MTPAEPAKRPPTRKAVAEKKAADKKAADKKPGTADKKRAGGAQPTANAPSIPPALAEWMERDPFDILGPVKLMVDSARLSADQAAVTARRLIENNWDTDDLMTDLSVFWGRAGAMSLDLARWSAGNLEKLTDALAVREQRKGPAPATTLVRVPRGATRLTVRKATLRRVGGGTRRVSTKAVTVSAPLLIDEVSMVSVSIDLTDEERGKVFEAQIELESDVGDGAITAIVTVPNFPTTPSS
jgi:hypothetical protein